MGGTKCNPSGSRVKKVDVIFASLQALEKLGTATGFWINRWQAYDFD